MLIPWPPREWDLLHLFHDRPPLNEIFKYQDKKSKNQAIYKVHQQYGYTLKDIVEYIGLHYTTVSRAIKKIELEDEKWYCKTWPHNLRWIEIKSKRIDQRCWKSIFQNASDIRTFKEKIEFKIKNNFRGKFQKCNI